MMKETSIEKLNINSYELFSKRWAALSSGTEQSGYNAMTIAWGTIGSLWEKEKHSNQLPVMTVFVRPNRYTNTVMSRNDYFSVAVFEEKDRKILGYLGSHTGRKENKYVGAGITPVFDDKVVYPKEAELVFICRKIYEASLKEENFIDQELIPFNYPDKDFHEVYIGQIEKVLIKEK